MPTGSNASLGNTLVANGTLTDAVVDGSHSVAPSAVTADLSESLLINVGTLCAGFLVWVFMKVTGLTFMRHCPKAGKLGTTVALNYIMFLQECRNMFWTLTALSAMATIPHWGLSPIAVGLRGHTLNTTGGLCSTGLALLCVDSAIRGVVALVFVEKLRRRIRRPLFRSLDRDAIQRTLWFSGLPVYDRATGQPFLFGDEDFQQVSNDLREAIDKDLNKRILGMAKQTEMKIEVAPVVDTWHEAAEAKRVAQERRDAYGELCNVHRKGCCGRLLTRHYIRKHTRYSNEVVRRTAELQSVAEEKKRICGAAFVTFAQVSQRDHFLRERPRCWQCRHHAYFTFGRPPFASVTLACMRAPHPSDVNWLNLHITRWQQCLRGASLILLLFIVMVTLVTPVTITSQLNVILPALRSRVEVIADCLHAKDFLLGHRVEYWYSFTNQLPALLLLIINSLLLPDCIARISEAIRPHRSSSVEVIQLHLNYVFMVLNSLLIPLLGLTSIGALIEWGQRRLNGDPMVVAANVLAKLMQSSGVFALRYTINCACLTNTNSLLQFAQLLYRSYARRAACTARELVEAEEQWTFAWGYWYAWNISIFTIGICLSTVVPSTLPCAAVFFSLQHAVDRYNLSHDVYKHGAESENLFVTRALHYMRCIVAIWWVLTGVSLHFFLQQRLAHTWDSRLPLKGVECVLGLMVVCGVSLMLFSWWDQQSILHDSHFQMVDISKRGMHRGGLCARIEKSCRRLFCCSQPQYQQVTMSTGDATDAEGFYTDAARSGSLELAALGNLGFDGGDQEEQERPIVVTYEGGLSWDAKRLVCNPESIPL